MKPTLHNPARSRAIRPLGVLQLVALLLTLTGCLGSNTTPGAEDAAGDSDPTCHYDCFANFTCEGGEVFYQRGRPIPCSEGGAEACDRGVSVGQCEEGCQDAVDVTAGVDGQNWRQMCEEHRPRAVGEPCASDDDCTPPELYLDEQSGELEPKTLVCDQERGRCVDPDTPDFLVHCEASFSQLDRGVGYFSAGGDVAIPGCTSSDFCFVQKSGSQTCQSCTIACEDDSECPAGSGCFAALDLESTDTTRRTICQPLDWDTVRDVVACR